MLGVRSCVRVPSRLTVSDLHSEELRYQRLPPIIAEVSGIIFTFVKAQMEAY